MRQSDNSEANATPIDVVLRPLAPVDIPALADLWVASWQETMPDIDFSRRRDWIVAMLDNPIHNTMVAHAQERPAGFAILEGTSLHQLVVAPWAKGHGIARVLLGGAKAASPDGLGLDVNQANPRAVRFYEREGFILGAAGHNPTSGLPTWSMHWAPRTGPADARSNA
jgi:putative acetyltransferase